MPASTYDAISTFTLTSDIQQVTITNIPQNYQDLVIVIDGTSTISTYIRANFGGTSFASGQKFSYVETLMGTSSPYSPSQFSGTGGYSSILGLNTRSQIFLNVLNYSSNVTNCSFIWESRQARSAGYWGIAGGTWFNLVGGSNIAGGMSSLTIFGDSGNIAAGTTVSVYGLTASNIKATGGDIIQTDGTYWYHAFTSSGTFTPQTSLTCDILVVAGGGSGGWPYSGGGGAGGVAYYTSQSLTAQNYSIGVGAGAAGGYNSGNGQQGSNSFFGSLTAAVGGGGGVGDSTITTARNGGSGGGGHPYGRGNPSTDNAGGTATVGQGNAGGSGSPSGYVNESGGGGGGAGSAGGNATTLDAGAGGSGTNSYNQWVLITGTGVGGYIAGGGGGGTNATSASTGAGGLGGGGRGASNDGYQQSESGTKNTGSGSGGGAAGGAQQSPKSGGSGLVIVRYAV